MLTCLVPVLFTFYKQGVLKLKNNSGAKGLIDGRGICRIYYIKYNYMFRRWTMAYCIASHSSPRYVLQTESITLRMAYESLQVHPATRQTKITHCQRIHRAERHQTRSVWCLYRHVTSSRPIAFRTHSCNVWTVVDTNMKNSFRFLEARIRVPPPPFWRNSWPNKIFVHFTRC